MHNPFIHVELDTNNLPKAKAFYGKLFNWKLKDMDMGPSGIYTLINAGKKGTGGGMVGDTRRGKSSAWMPYVLVKDIDAATKKAKKLGAKISQGVTEVHGMGWLSVIVDPTGAVLGLWEPR
jgi:predicted enzyme related to lactoylglutathione lyase